MFIIFIQSGSADHKNLTAEPGQDITLPCKAPDSSRIVVAMWGRPELGSEYVFLYRNGKIDPEDQHPSFKNRVGLKERELKDGDVSLILRNVTTNDTGTYECRVVQTVKNNRTETVVIINLDVQPPPGEPNGGSLMWIAVGIILLVVLAILIFGLVYLCKNCERKSKESIPPDESKPPEESKPPDETLECRESLMDQNRTAEQ